MRVYVHGQSKHLPKKELQFAAKFIYSLLVTKREFDKTTINIHFVEPKEMDTHHGLTICRARVNAYPKRFHVLLNKKFRRKFLLMILAHELVHCKQYSRNELGQRFDRKKDRWIMRFEKKFYDDERLCYWEMPWEIEAFGRELGLYVRYTQFIYKHQIFHYAKKTKTPPRGKGGVRRVRSRRERPKSSRGG